MTYFKLLLTLVVTCVGLSGCGQLGKQSELDKSLETWKALKAQNGGYYRYEVSAGSVFGPAYETTLTVQKDEVVQRDLAISEVDDEGNVTVTKVWSETGEALGTHDEGAELLTIDERYRRCRDEVLGQNPASHDIFLEFQVNGVIKECSYIPKNVAYDGGAEVITSLEFLRNPAKQSELATSLETWQTLKAQNSDYYRYETSFASFFGFGSTTTLTVQNDQTVVRAYEAYTYNDSGDKEVGETWTEVGAAVGSHEAGAEPRTVDELYGVCQSEVLMQNALENELYLDFRDDGVLETCGYVPKNCADDCFMGVTIETLEFLPAKPE